MKNSLITVALVVLMAFCAPMSYANMMNESAAPGNSLETLKVSPTKGEDGLIHLNNKICPVGGEETGKDTMTHEGVVYNLCCAMCSGKFKNNPSKYAIPAEEIQTVLAGVMG